MRISCLAQYALISLLLSAAPSFSEPTFEILKQTQQNPIAFTQGFVKEDDHFYISSGLYGRSFVSKFDESGKELARFELEDRYFAEGITAVGDTLILLTWKAGKGFFLSLENLALEAEFNYEGDGWGLADDGQTLYLSDGSHYIQHRSPKNFELLRYTRVTYNGRPLKKLNELEFVDGALWANVWFDHHIYRIEPSTGRVTHRWNLSELHAREHLDDPAAVLNGIAYDRQEKAFWVTGKHWKNRYLIRFEI